MTEPHTPDPVAAPDAGRADDPDAASERGAPAENPSPHRNAFTAWLDTRFRNPAAIYGLLVFQAFIAIDSDDAHDVWEVLATSVSTLVVFFIAHVFAEVLTHHGRHGFWVATWHAMQHASGMLYAAIPASLVMIVGALQGSDMDDVFGETMLVTWVVLAVLGYAAYSARGAHVVMRILGALGTAALGIVIVLLEYAIH